MSIARMKKLRVIALREQRDGLMEQLLRLGCVQVEKPEGMLSDPEAAELLRPERVDLTRLRTDSAQINAAVKLLERYAPEKKKLLAPRPEVGQDEFLSSAALERDMTLAEKLCGWESQIRRIAADQARICTEIEALRPWEPMDEALDGAGTKTCAAALFSCVSQVEMDSVADAAEAATDAVQLILVSSDAEQHCFIAVAFREEIDAVADALRAIGCTQVTFPGMAGTAKENTARLVAELAALAADKKTLEAQIASCGDKLSALRLSADRMQTELDRAETLERLAGTDNIVAMEGWCPEGDAPRLQKTLEGFDCAWEFSDPAPEEYPDVPVKLQNRRLARPMNLVTEMYSLPAYDGIDPNPLMLPFFVLFYGIMMADMGYGLLMMLASVIALKKMKPRGGTGYLMQLLGLCGISTFIFGAMTGGFFGDLLPQIAAMINPDTAFTAMPALFTPLEDTMMILVGSLALGVVQIFTGMIVNVVHKCKNGEALSALFDEGAWWCILIGAALMILGVGNIGGVPVVLCAGGVLLVAGQFVEKKSLIKGLTGLFGAIYNGVTGYFSDILSYSRLMALMLSGSVIASVFNTLGSMTGNAVTFVIIAMLGNTLNFALNLLSCFVHDLRLQVLEFFNRFYKDGGKPFKPLDIDTKYVDVIKEEI